MPGRIPDLIGVQVQQGYALLHRDGLRVTVPRAFALCAPHDEVAFIEEVTPRAGERYRTGSAITVTVAPHVVSSATTSRHIVTYAVPGFIGRPLSAATRWIEHKNLDLAENYGPLRSASAATFDENYRVVRQSPAAGTSLRLGITTKTGDFVTTPLVVWLAQVR